MAWFLVIIAGMFEVGWASTLKLTEGFTRLWPSLLNLCLMALSVYCISTAVKSLPIGTAYAVWTGIGAIGAVVVGIIFYKDPISLLRLLFLGLIVVGIIGLNITSH
ncbi:MAG TPA: multidrug efflux SMR transporter [Firmicutes bacterium]|nr:multidrug efflux SMR transporter [Bacillota bacterium]